MNDDAQTAARSAAELIDALTGALPELSPETRKAATYVIENPQEVGVSSIREIAEAANVKPNTFVRMARQVGLGGYEDFREAFREEIRRGTASFPDRARWLQSIGAEGDMGGLYADMVSAAIRNIEETFAGISPASLAQAATTIWRARQVFVLGVGVNNANARNFAYLASTGLEGFVAIPGPGAVAADDIARAGPEDAIIAMTCRPYRTEVVETVAMAREQGLKVVAISDSPVAPIIRGADHAFVVSADTPQFFPSSVSTIALLETLLSFVIAAGSPDIPGRVERFHARRHAMGLYHQDRVPQ